MPKKRETEEKPKDIPLPDESTVICLVEKLLGGDHFLARCLDGYTRVTRIPGKFRKRVWIKEGDIVLVAPWDTQPDRRGDMVYKYWSDEVKKLVEKGILSPELLEGLT